MKSRFLGQIAICFASLIYASEESVDNHKNAAPSPLVAFKDELKIGGFGPEMVVVPVAGRKLANCIAETVCDATITDIVRSMIPSVYAISVFEITFDEYDAYSEATGRESPEDNGWGRGRRPVIFIAWKEALAYADWLSDQTGFTYRLPSVIEWEHAARAGRHTAYWWGPELGANQANCSDCGSRWSKEQTAPVGSFPSNPWGIYDMHGNVSEFTRDCAIKKRRFRFRVSRRSLLELNRLSAESRFFLKCGQVRLKGADWLSTYYLPFRRESDRNNPYFPERFKAYPERYASAAVGIRVVREI